MKISISISRLVSCVCNLNVCNLKEKAMKNLKTIVATTILVALPNLAAAQPQGGSSSEPSTPPAPTASASATVSTSTPPTASASASATTPAPAPKPASALMPQTMSESITAYPFFVNWVSTKIGIKWAKTVEGGAIKDALDSISKESEKKEAGESLSLIPQGSLTVFEFIHQNPMVPAKFLAYLKANGCEPVMEGDKVKLDIAKREIWTPGCMTLGEKLVKIVDPAIASSKAEPAAKTNAKSTLDKALPLMKGSKVKGADGKDTDVDTIVRGADGIALIHLSAFGGLTFAEWAKAYGIRDDLGSFLNGKPACWLIIGKDADCGTIDSASADGISMNGQTRTLDQIIGNDGPGLGFGSHLKDGWNKGSTSYAEKNRAFLEGRFEYIQGWAEGYNNPSITAGMVGGGVNVHDNVRIHAFAGLGRLGGQPVTGTEPSDSDWIFVAKIGGRFLLVPRNPYLAPMIEANATFQGLRPGVQGVLGVEVLPESPVDISAGISLGYYPTGVAPSCHPFKGCQDVNLFGVGFVIAAGGTF